MTSGDEAPPRRKSGDTRAERLAAALKQNLKKRKELARARHRDEGGRKSTAKRDGGEG